MPSIRSPKSDKGRPIVYAGQYDQDGNEWIPLDQAESMGLVNQKNKIKVLSDLTKYRSSKFTTLSGKIINVYIVKNNNNNHEKGDKIKNPPKKIINTKSGGSEVESQIKSTLPSDPIITQSNQDTPSSADPNSTGGKEPTGPSFMDGVTNGVRGAVNAIGTGLDGIGNGIGDIGSGIGRGGKYVLGLGTELLKRISNLFSSSDTKTEPSKKETRTASVTKDPEVKSEIKSVKTETSIINSMFSNFPFFRKSYSVLDQLTPFLDITVILPPFGTNFYGDNKELTLFNVPYNNVVSFEMESVEANKNSKLVIHDTTDSFFLAIYLYLQKTSSTSQIQTKIRYGWVDERAPRFRKRETKPIYNTSDLFSITGVEMSVEDSKNIFTLTLSKTNAKTPLDVSFRPFYHLSRTPLLGLAIAKETASIMLVLKKILSQEESFSVSKLMLLALEDEASGARDYLLNRYRIQELRECEEFISNYYMNIFSSSDEKEKITFDNYVNESSSFTGLIDDKILKLDSVPTPIALYVSNQTFTPAEAFYFLCKQMRINMEFLNSRLSLSGKQEVYFLSLIDEKDLKWDFEARTEKLNVLGEQPFFEKIKKLKISDLTINENESWIDLLKKVAKDVAMYTVDTQFKSTVNKSNKIKKEIKFIQKIANIEIKEITITKTANYENDIQNVITFIEGLDRSVDERNRYNEISFSLKEFTKKALSKIKEFKNKDDFDTLTLIIINPRFLSEEETGYNSTDALEQLLNRKRNDVLQTYSVRPFKALGDTTFSSNLRNLSQEFFPDVISFKPSLTGVMQTLEQVGKVQNLKATGYSSGSVHYINNEPAYLGAQFAPLNSIISSSYPFFSTSQNYSDEYINNIADKNRFTEIFREYLGLMTAELVILGEPALSLFEVSNLKSIFIKVFNEDSTYSILSGLYTITNVKHSIASGKFTTTLTLRRDAALNKNLILNSLSGEIGFNDTIAVEGKDMTKLELNGEVLKNDKVWKVMKNTETA